MRGEHKMSATYGIKRVLEPKNVLPTSAWKLDNGRNIFPDELRVSIKRIHLEGTGFKQICTESNDDEKKIKQNIIDSTKALYTSFTALPGLRLEKPPSLLYNKHRNL